MNDQERAAQVDQHSALRAKLAAELEHRIDRERREGIIDKATAREWLITFRGRAELRSPGVYGPLSFADLSASELLELAAALPDALEKTRRHALAVRQSGDAGREREIRAMIAALDALGAHRILP